MSSSSSSSDAYVVFEKKNVYLWARESDVSPQLHISHHMVPSPFSNKATELSYNGWQARVTNETITFKKGETTQTWTFPLSTMGVKVLSNAGPKEKESVLTLSDYILFLCLALICGILIGLIGLSKK
jgi:hypothetical protein